jgi:hypothetical protein
METCPISTLVLNFQEVQAEFAEKDVIKNALEAVMCMKTNKNRIKCPRKNRTILHNRHAFCRKKRLCKDILPLRIAFSRVLLCKVQPVLDLSVAVHHKVRVMASQFARMDPRKSQRAGGI